MANKFKACSVPGCNRNSDHTAGGALGFCRNHYIRDRRNGSPTAGRASPGEPERWLLAQINFDGDECLIWPFGKNKYYPTVKHVDGISKRAHRMMCELVHGDPPTLNHEAAHTCGMGHNGCVHPLHVRWLTPKENQADRVVHGTNQRGESHAMSKLTEQDVRKIRSMAGKAEQRDIANNFGISQTTVSEIQNRKKWAWLD